MNYCLYNAFFPSKRNYARAGLFFVIRSGVMTIICYITAGGGGLAESIQYHDKKPLKQSYKYQHQLQTTVVASSKISSTIFATNDFAFRILSSTLNL